MGPTSMGSGRERRTGRRGGEGRGPATRLYGYTTVATVALFNQ